MRADRIDRQEEVLVDIISCEDDPEMSDVHLCAKTIDLSAFGMKVALGVSVPEKSHLGLRLDLGDEVYRLEGNVRWAVDDDRGFIGIELEKASPDYEKWVALFGEIQVADQQMASFQA